MQTLSDWLNWLLTTSITVRVLLLAVVVGLIALISARSRRAWSRQQQARLARERALEDERRWRQEVENGTDLVALAALARGDNAGVAPLAARRLQTLIEQKDPGLTTVTDESVLGVIARSPFHTFSAKLRRRAIARLANQSILAAIVEGANADPSIRAAAVERISDPAVALRLVRALMRRLPPFDDPSHEDVAVLVTLVKKTTDQSLLAGIALQEDRRSEPRIPLACVMAAVERIEDPQLLHAVCKKFAPRFSAGEHQSAICEAALARISDQALLLETAQAIDQNGLGGRHLRLIRGRITDPKLQLRLDELSNRNNKERERWTETK